MSLIWPKVRLAEVLKPISREEPVDTVKEYRMLGIRLDGQGPFLRETIMGTQTAATKLYRVTKGDFIYSRLFACRGAFGVINEELDGCHVSGEFPTFLPVPGRIDVNFLRYWFRLPTILSRVEEDCTGSTPLTRNRFKEHFFLALEIPLPSLAEQKRIVARIEELAAQINEARILRQETIDEVENLVGSKASIIFQNALKNGNKKLESIAILERGKFSHRPRNEPRFFGGVHPWIQIGEIESSAKFIRNWSQTLNDDGLAISKKFPRGTVLISIAATIGSVGILDFDCCVPDSIVGLTPHKGIDSEFIYYYLGYLRGHLEEIAPQSAQKNINLKILSDLPVPNLSLSEQRRIVKELDALQAEVDKLKCFQNETAAEIDALLPSILDRAFKGEL